MSKYLLIVAALSLAGCENDTVAQMEFMAKAKIVKICRSGTYIWQMPDGTYRVRDPYGYRVDSPDVCQ